VIGDPRDRSAYGISLATLGVALTVLLAGICWVITQQPSDSNHTTLEVCRIADHCVVTKVEVLSQPSIASGLWIALAALGGVLVGALVPMFSLIGRSNRRERIFNWLVYALLVTIAVIAVLVVKPILTQLILAAGLGGLLLGFLIPPPVDGD
jgi:MFS family permease